MPEKSESENLTRYRTIVNKFPALICCYLPDGEISFVNEAYCNYFEKTSDELVGSNFLSLIPESDRQTVMNNISTLTVDSPSQSHDHCVITAKGEIGWQRWINHAIFDDEEKVVEYHSIGEDITESKQAEKMLRKSEEFHRITISNISDAIFITDEAGFFTYICPNVKVIFGYSYEEVKEIENIKYLMADQLFSPSELESSGELKNLEHVIQDKSGTNHDLLVNVKRVSIGGGTILYTCRDITERKQAQTKLAELNSTLAERTKLAEQRAAYIQQLAMELTKAEDRERQRIADLLHGDLQQMLAYLKLQFSTLKKGPEEIDKFDAINDLIGNCIERCRDLSHELKPFVSQQKDFLGALKWICREMKEHYGLEVSLQAGTDLEIESSVLSSLLVRAIRELLFNVVKHSGAIKASLNLRFEGRHMIVTVKDTGVGCNPAVLRAKRESNSAFGLFDIEDRINFIGGHMHIQTRPGGGFCVILWVPKDVYC